VEEKQQKGNRTIWVNGHLLNGGGKQPKPAVQNILEKLGLKLVHAVPSYEHSSGKDLIQISGPNEVIDGLNLFIKAKVV